MNIPGSSLNVSNTQHKCLPAQLRIVSALQNISTGGNAVVREHQRVLVVDTLATINLSLAAKNISEHFYKYEQYNLLNRLFCKTLTES